MITRIAFLAPQPLEKKAVDVPGRGRLYVRAMTAGERDEFEVSHAKARTDFRGRLVAMTACDEDGTLLFTAEDIPALSAMAASVLQPIVVASTVVNRLTADDVQDLEEAAGN